MRYSASFRRPGNCTANKFPNCTPKQAEVFADYVWRNGRWIKKSRRAA